MTFIPLSKLIPEGTDEQLVCGLDEAGRGPWAGPVVACALMFKAQNPSGKASPLRLPNLKDSKHLSLDRRNEFYELLTKKTAYGVGMASPEEIDRLGLLKANNLAFQRALDELEAKGPVPSFILVDGRDRLNLPHPWKTIIKGDEKVKIIACASIIAKVVRDRIMDELALKYPKYGFQSHKGYGTREHQKALKKYGSCDIHRKSFAPVHELLQLTIE